MLAHCFRRPFVALTFEQFKQMQALLRLFDIALAMLHRPVGNIDDVCGRPTTAYVIVSSSRLRRIA